MAESLIAPGSVWLVGAGPGDPDLLTRKAERLVQSASIVFHDALVGSGVLDLIPPGVRRVAVGKRAGRHLCSQAAINRRLVDAALAGERVVRLKGGDPSIFGRSAEELAALAEHRIPVRVCPGITAASAAAAGAGLSLTRRGAARQLVFVTGHACAGEDFDLDWASLASARSTLAFYMGKSSAGRIACELIAAGLDEHLPVLIVENASLAGERRLWTRLGLMGLAAASLASEGPMILLIGEAMNGPDPADRRASASLRRESSLTAGC
jgi:uroporphyrin-III C-methyltransferase